MYTIEGDLESCIAAIRAQEGVVTSHVIISGLKEKEAHNALWRSWRDAQSSNDIFVKIDADTVLASKDTLRQLCELFASDRRITGVQMPLHDYMTDGFINGLNSFSTKVVFNDTKDELYCDRQVDTNHDRVLRDPNLPECLRPAGLHCHHANEQQAFHYGLHRSLKGQSANLDKVLNAWKRDRDRIRGFALIGSRVSSEFVMSREFNYQDRQFTETFARVSKEYDRLIAEIESGATHVNT